MVQTCSSRTTLAKRLQRWPKSPVAKVRISLKALQCKKYEAVPPSKSNSHRHKSHITNERPNKQLLAGDKEAQKYAPQVLKDSIKNGQTPPKGQSRPFSTYARRQQLEVSGEKPAASLDPPVFGVEVSELTASSTVPSAPAPGHKFPLPTLPLPSNAHKDYRYDPVVRQVTNLMMQDGKLSVAQRNMSLILQHLRTASPPSYNPARPLLPGARTVCFFYFSRYPSPPSAHPHTGHIHTHTHTQ